MPVLTPEIRELLAGANYVHLASLMPDGAPHSVPVWVELQEGDRLLFGTQSGSRKARNVERDPRVALSVVDLHDPYRTAHLRGRVVDRITGQPAQDAFDRMARRYTGRDFPKLPNNVVYTVEIERAGHMRLSFTHEG